MNHFVYIEGKPITYKTKCEYWLNQVIFLKHVVNKEGIAVYHSKVEAVLNWSCLSNVSKVKSFLGLANYYKRFMHRFSTIAVFMTRWLQKDQKFERSDKCKASFLKFKEKLTTSSIITLPSSVQGFKVFSDASLQGLDCVLIQYGKVVTYASPQLKHHEKSTPRNI